MAVPTFVAAGTSATGVGAVTPGLPAGWAQDDIFLLVVQAEGAGSFSTPSGYTTIDSVNGITSGVGSTAMALYYKRATASESAPTVNDTGDHTFAVILAFRGCVASGSPVATFATGIGFSSTSVSFSAITTTSGENLIVLAGTHGIDTTGGQASGYTNAALSSLAELFDDSTTDGTGGGIFIAAGGKTAAGSTGSTSATLASAANSIAYTVALKPPALGFPFTRNTFSHVIGR
jgi:hypothetical protein